MLFTVLKLENFRGCSHSSRGCALDALSLPSTAICEEFHHHRDLGLAEQLKPARKSGLKEGQVSPSVVMHIPLLLQCLGYFSM